MDTIIEGLTQLFIYFFENVSKKQVKELDENINLDIKKKQKGGAYINTYKTKYTYSIEHPDPFLKELEFETTKELDVPTEVFVIGPKNKKQILYYEPEEFFSEQAFSDLIKKLKGEDDESGD